MQKKEAELGRPRMRDRVQEVQGLGEETGEDWVRSTWRLMGREEGQADVEEEQVFLKNSCSFWASLSCNSVLHKEAPNTDACWECDTDLC